MTNIIQEVTDVSTDCCVCQNQTRIQYKLDDESDWSACCASCFLGWLKENDAVVDVSVPDLENNG